MRISDWSSDVCSSDLTTSVNADTPKPTLLPYATTKGAIQNFTGGLAQLLGEKKIRVNCVAPGPVWTPLIPSTMPPDQVKEFGKNTPLGRPAQPKELAPAYVMLATDEASYVSGATIAVTGGKPKIGRATVRTPVTNAHHVC